MVQFLLSLFGFIAFAREVSSHPEPAHSLLIRQGDPRTRKIHIKPTRRLCAIFCCEDFCFMLDIKYTTIYVIFMYFILENLILYYNYFNKIIYVDNFD